MLYIGQQQTYGKCCIRAPSKVTFHTNLTCCVFVIGDVVVVVVFVVIVAGAVASAAEAVVVIAFVHPDFDHLDMCDPVSNYQIPFVSNE